MLRFLRQTLQDYYHVGAIAPSSRSLARALAWALEQRPADGPMRVLEVGPGTGALTRGIFEKLRPRDQLVLCEINEAFVHALEERFSADPEFSKWRSNTHIVCMPVQDFSAETTFHHIICGLPFNNFPPELVAEIFSKFSSLLLPGGTASYFEYAWIRPLKRLVSSPEERKRIDRVGAVLGDLIRRYEVRRQLVLWNLPPAWARILCFTPAATSSGQCSANNGARLELPSP